VRGLVRSRAARDRASRGPARDSDLLFAVVAPVPRNGDWLRGMPSAVLRAVGAPATWEARVP